MHMSLGVKVFVELYFLIVYVQISAIELESDEKKGVCYFPGSNLNTVFEGENVTFPVPENTIANYSCFDEDVTMNRTDTVRCLANSQWSGELPICGNSTSWCPSSKDIETVIAAEGMCIHFSKGIRLNFTTANETCRQEVNGTIIKPETPSIQLLLKKHVNYMRRYYWIEAPTTLEGRNGYMPKEKELWQGCDQINEQDCCFALDNMTNYNLIERKCSLRNTWICQSAYISCGYPDRKPITLMKITQKNGKNPLEVEYYCPDGFTLSGNRKRICEENGHWSEEAPTCIWNDNNAIEGSSHNEIAVPNEDSAEEMENRSNIYIITGAGTSLAIVLIFTGLILYRRNKKKENEANQNICPREVASFDSETLVSMEELYEEIALERRDNLKIDEGYEMSDGYASIDEVKRKADEDSNLSSDGIKRSLALPTLPEEHHSHLEGQNYNSTEMKTLQEAPTPKGDFIMVDNDLYNCSDDSDTDECN